jgi:O-succinylbenzoate synthase
MSISFQEWFVDSRRCRVLRTNVGNKVARVRVGIVPALGDAPIGERVRLEETTDHHLAADTARAVFIGEQR